MKKILIALSAVLLLVSFTGCDNQEKIDEALAEQKNVVLSFIDTATVANKYTKGADLAGEAREYDLSKYNDSADTTTIKNLICNLLNRSNDEYSCFVEGSEFVKITSASGTVKIEESGGTKTTTFKDINIVAEVNNSAGKDVTGKLTLDGVISVKETSRGSAESTTRELKVTGLNENGTSYKDIEVTYTKEHSNSAVTFSKAVCDGTSLDLDLLNKFYKLNNNFSSGM